MENVAGGDVSPAGLREKVSFVITTVDEKMKEVGESWDLVTQTRIYTVHAVGELIPEVILPCVGPDGRHGVTWHYKYPR